MAVRSKRGGAVRERYLYKTAVKGLGKKKTVVAAGRRMAELMYSVLRNKSVYEPRPCLKIRMDAVCFRRHGCRCFYCFRRSFAKQNSLA